MSVDEEKQTKKNSKLGTTPRLPRHRGDEGLRLLHGLEANLATSLQTLQEA